MDSGGKGRDKEKKKWLKGVYEDNLSRIARVKVEIKKSKKI
jgi:hypothetical protein